MVSFVIPCYNSEHTITAVVDGIEAAMYDLKISEYEIVLVDDCSTDGVLQVIQGICQINPRVQALALAKNFGQHAAIMAGIRQATGDTFVFLDDDGQTPTSEVGKLLSALNEDTDAVYAKYEKKHHAAWRNLGTRVNDWMGEILVGRPKDVSITSFFACKKYVIEEVRKYTGTYPYMAGLVMRATSRITSVCVDHHERQAGSSGYTFKKLLSLWLNGFTTFSVKPLRMATILGFVFAIFGFLFIGYTIVLKLINPIAPMGYSSTMAVLLFVGGMLMIMLGLVGEYIGRIYINSNSAPQYVIREEYGTKAQSEHQVR